ncbi:SDR family oxidoreductase [uncultured Alsobacter sp.]|uniref:SDR family oxidoreductase n=1 Tax=uncultured Alsobacter sp. TaxID=1748258 RepID=UPI0025F11705|nr:SDR family oxidoreductase [uncultured Alsobacter sp.]
MAGQRTALVTGGAAGIGAALCASLLADGYSVVSIDRNQPAATVPGRTDLVCDLTDIAATEAVAREVAAQHRITHFVHNAGTVRANLMESATPADLAALTQLHLGSALTLAQAVLPGMKDAGTGRIVLMSSRAALGTVTRTAYSATKAGVIGMVRTWALELARHGITVNAVAPGPIGGTDMFHEVLPKGDPRIEGLAASIPVKRLGTPEDVVNAVRFFIADESGFVTGQTLYVCGGASVGQAGV